MPSLGADMEAGTLVEWLKAPGDRIEQGDIIAVVETDKGAIEVEVFESGLIAQLLVEPGSKVPVGSALAKIDGVDGPEHEAEGVTEAPRDVPIAEDAPVPLPPAAPPPVEGQRASPAARKRAAELGIDLADLTGTGPGGAIQLADVEPTATDREREKAIDPGPMRRAIAAAMLRSKREIPHYYLTHRFDMSTTLRWLEEYNADRPAPARLLLGALLIKAAALALREFPEFNGHHQEGAFRPSAQIHIGSAIAIRGGGLAAPAIRNTDQLSLTQLMDKLRDLVARTRRGQFRSSEIGDATVTISSLGDRGVESVLPIIYPPQVAIIGFGRVTPSPWAVGDTLAVRPVITATLAGDHRVNDGHGGALFLRRIAELLTHPEEL